MNPCTWIYRRDGFFLPCTECGNGDEECSIFLCFCVVRLFGHDEPSDLLEEGIPMNIIGRCLTQKILPFIIQVMYVGWSVSALHFVRTQVTTHRVIHPSLKKPIYNNLLAPAPGLVRITRELFQTSSASSASYSRHKDRPSVVPPSPGRRRGRPSAGLSGIVDRLGKVSAVVPSKAILVANEKMANTNVHTVLDGRSTPNSPPTR